MNRKIQKVLRKITDKSLHELASNIIETHYKEFISQPGGCSRHHAYKGGLLDHSVDTALLASEIAARYPRANPKLNHSLIVTGALLHDIGKVECYSYNKKKDKFESTLRSRWQHHIPIGYHIVATEVDELIYEGKLDEDLADHLLHIIVSHHGRVEYRSPQPPKTDEAFIVSQADLIDAYMGASSSAKKTFNKPKVGET